MSLPIHVIGGYLGAGKTTAMAEILMMYPDERIAVVVNDFGTSALDQRALGERGANVATVREIRGGCVCCTAPEGFVGAVASLLEDKTLDRILVEPTGLARPADLIDTLRRAPYALQLAIQPLVVLVDPQVLAADPHGRVADQAQVADVLLANRVDLASLASLEHFRAWSDALWPKPMLVAEISHGKLPAEALSWAEGQGPRAVSHQHHHRHDQDHAVVSLSWPPDAVFSRTRLLAWFAEPGHRVVRIKGVFRTDEGWCKLERSGGAVHESVTGYRRDSRVDTIAEGASDPVREAALQHALEAAILGATERARAADALEVLLPDGSSRRFDRAALMALAGGIADVSTLLPGRVGAAASLSSLLAAVGAPEVGFAVVVASDGFTTEPVPLSALSTALLLHSVHGQPMSAKKGGPVRLMIPGDAGPGGPCANVKAVVRISVR